MRPPDKGEDVATFVRIDRHLLSLGLSAPRVLAEDTEQGFLLLEDLGDDLLARLVPRDPSRENSLYSAATDVLTTLQSHPPAPDLPAYDAAAMASAIAPAVDWYRFAATGDRADPRPLQDTLETLLLRHADDPPVMILRDYHAENLLWLPDRQGVARVGLLDFQQAMLSHRAVDLVSLLQDARRDISPAVETAMIHRFAATMGWAEAPFRTAYALIGAQRHLRILGIFTRLSLHYGKPQYTDYIPRVWRDLQRDLAHPALSDLAAQVARLLPPPTPALLQRIKDQCGTIPTP